jgi:hypothetical protein
MTCPKPEVLSQWADGSLDPRESAAVGRHAETCDACGRKAAELRAVGAWIATAGVPGPACLSPEDMAAVLEGGRVPAHVRTCPRCASEFRALRTAERKGTRRRHKQPAPMTAWVAAAAVFIAVGILLFVANQQTRKPEGIEVRVPTFPENVEPKKPLPPPEKPPVVKPAVPDEPLKPNSFRNDPPVKPPQDPPVKPPIVENPEQPPVKPPTPPETPKKETLTTPRAIAAVTLRAGGLSALTDGKWVKATKVEEGVALRADGRTQIDFAQARITLDASSRFTVQKDEMALNEGGLSADVSAGSKFALVLEEHRIVPQTLGRVMFCARPDRVVVEEGSAKIKDALLAEGVEYLVKKDKVEAQKRRALPPAVRPAEKIIAKMDLRQEAVKRNLNGHVEKDGENRFLVSNALPAGDPFFYGVASYFSTGDEPPLFVARPNTAVRFRYYVTQPGALEFVMKNITKDENFNRSIDPVVRQWTTVTLYARDVLANPGGKKVTCDVGDRYLGVTWFVGKPGVPAEVYIDRFEILEIDR